MARSHLQKHLRKQSIRNSFLGIGGIIILIIILFSFGPQLLITFSLLVKGNDEDVSQKTKKIAYVAPPTINPLPTATNSATIIVSGTTTTGEIIKLYINGKVTDKTSVKKNSLFTFSSVKLTKGTNEIKAKTVTEDEQESNYSPTIIIQYLDKAPSLEITFPQDGQTVNSNPITVTGKTDGGAKVTVSDFWAITNDDGTFSYRLNLQQGDNRVKIVATDEAGNKVEKEITIKRE